MNVLLIEDDAETAEFVIEGLGQIGYQIDRATTGQKGLALAASREHDLLVVDCVLPDLDGLTVARRLRMDGDDRPILFLTALGSVFDRMEGLEAGGDDYLAKPFALSELVARLGALMRRASGRMLAIHIRVADLELDRLHHTVVRAGRTIDLRPTAYRLLEYLMLHAGQSVTRAMLLENVWGFHFEPGTMIVETTVSRLRNKIDRDFDRPLIETVQGGYCLRDPG